MKHNIVLIQDGEEVPIKPDVELRVIVEGVRGDGEMHYVFTHEGVIVDLYENYDNPGTTSFTYEEHADELEEICDRKGG